MVVLLEYFNAHPVGVCEHRVRLCPVCGRPFEEGQVKLGYFDRATSGYYEVHDGCEVGLPSFIENQEVDCDGDLSFAC